MVNNNRVSGKELKSSLMLVTLAASFGLPFFALTGGPALTGFTRQLGAGDFVYTVIMSMPVIGAVIQVLMSYIIEATGRRKSMKITSGLIHRLLWIPIALVPFIILPDYTNARIWTVTIIIAISATANSINGIAFNSWMGSLVPTEIKGRFFGKRTMIYTITGGIAALAGGKLMDINPGLPGFSIVFIIAAVLGTIDIVMFFWIKEPSLKRPDKVPVFHKMFTEPFKNKNYMKYTLFIALWYFGVNITAPFLSVYMIEELRMSYLAITLFTQVAASFTTILFIRFWGRLADKYGSKPVMWLCCVAIIIMPLMWIFVTRDSIWIVLVINLLSGIFWSGFELTAMNQSIWLAPEQNRSIYIANYSLVVNVIGAALAFLCGGAFMQLTGNAVRALQLPLLGGQFLSSYHLLFFISGIVRLLVVILVFRSYGEKNSKTAADIMSGLFFGVRAGIHR